MSFESDSILPPLTNHLRSLREFLGLIGYRGVPPSPFPWREDVLESMSKHSTEPYESFSGVYLLIYRDSLPGLRVYTRTNSWCSRWDLDQQIRTVRLLKRHFGGKFVTDAGTNRYWRNDQLDMRPAEAGCFLAFERFQQSIDRAVHYLADREFLPTWSDPSRNKLADVLNPRLFSNNLLLPYLVAAMEDYFKSTFIAIARYSADKESLFKNARIAPERLARVSVGNAALEDVVAEGMSFQKLDGVCRQFRALDKRIDFAGTLQRPFRRRQSSLYRAVELLVTRRHDLIHRNIIDLSFEDLDVSRLADDLYSAVSKCHEHLIAVQRWTAGTQSAPSWSAKRRLREAQKPGPVGPSRKKF